MYSRTLTFEEIKTLVNRASKLSNPKTAARMVARAHDACPDPCLIRCTLRSLYAELTAECVDVESLQDELAATADRGWEQSDYDARWC